MDTIAQGNPMKLLWLLAMMPALAVAGDSVYVYGDSGNVGYDCTVYHAYFDTEGYATLFADRCDPPG